MLQVKKSSSRILFFIETLIKGVLSIGFVPITSLILLPVYTTNLTLYEFGVYGVLMVYINNVSFVVNPGIMSVVIREFKNEDSQLAKKYFIQVFQLSFLIGFVASLGAVIYIIISQDSDVANLFSYLAIFFIGISLQPVKLWLNFEASLGHFRQISRISLVLILLSIVLTLCIIYLLNLNLLGRVFPMLFINISLLIIALRKHKFLLRFDRNILLSLMSQSIRYFLTIMSNHVYLIFPVLYLKHNYDIETVGLFTFGLYLASLPNALVEGIGFVWTPRYYHQKNMGLGAATKKELFFWVLVLLFSFLILYMILSFLSKSVTNIAEVYQLLPVLFIYATVNGITKIIVPIANYTYNYWDQSKVNIFITALYLLSSLIFLPNLYQTIVLLVLSRVLILLGYVVLNREDFKVLMSVR